MNTTTTTATPTIDVEPSPAQPLVPRPNGTLPPVAMSPSAATRDTLAQLQRLPGLLKGLLRAMSAVRPVPEQGENSYHKYKYAEADAIIKEARHAMTEGGIGLIPLELTIDGTDREGQDRFEVHRTFLLGHAESGECLPIKMVWPICVDRGRPLDKAAAAADTLSLAYYLRDLLVMDRVKQEDDVSARADRPQQHGKSTKAPADGAKTLRRIVATEAALIEDGKAVGLVLCAENELVSEVRLKLEQAGHKAHEGTWSPEACELARATAVQFKEVRRGGTIHDLCNQAGVGAWSPTVAGLLGLPRDATPAKLTAEQFKAVVKRLQQELARNQQQAAR